MFTSDELFILHKHLCEILNKEIRLNHYSDAPNMVSWYHAHNNYVIEKQDDRYQVYSYQTPQDTKAIDKEALPIFSDIKSCLDYVL